MAYNRKQSLIANITAIDTAFRLVKENNPPTELERSQLENYTGFGGLRIILKDINNTTEWGKGDLQLLPYVKQLWEILQEHSRNMGIVDENKYRAMVNSIKSSVMTAFYTPEKFLNALLIGLKDLIDAPEKVLEPSAGNGRFLRMFDNWPGVANTQFRAFEKDIITGTVLKAIEPHTNVTIGGFETISHEELGTYDMIISNIPFGDFKVYDPLMKEGVRRQATNQIHNYFFVKGLDALREGGLLIYITTKNMADSQSNKSVREYLMNNSNLISAIRLPNELFYDDGITDIGTDLIILQKNSQKQNLTEEEKNFIEADEWQYYENEYGKDIVGMIAKNRYINNGCDDENYIGLPYGDTDQFGNMTIKFDGEDELKQLDRYLPELLKRDFSRRYNKELLKENKIEQPVQQEMNLWDLWGLTSDERTQIKTTGKKKRSTAVKPAVVLPLTNKPYQLPENDILKTHYGVGTIVKLNNELGVLERNKNVFEFSPKQLAENEKNILEKYSLIRDTYWMLFDSEKITATPSPALRKLLNDYYDEFVQSFGGMKDAKNVALLMIDPAYNEIAALEKYVDGERVKADIFLEPVSIIGYKDINQILTVEEALTTSLNLYGSVDVDFIMEKTGREEEEVLTSLKGKIYYNPVTEEWEDKNVIISGNVYEKIEDYKYELEILNNQQEGTDETKKYIGYIEETISALEDSKPKIIPFEELDFNFGERWIPTRFYEEFINDLMQTDDTSVTYIPGADQFVIKTSYTYNVGLQWKVKVGWQEKLSPIDILNNAILNIFPEVKGKDGVDAEATQLAAVKIQDIRSRFVDWFNEISLDDKDLITNLYNERFNCFVKPQYDGSYQTFPGLSFEKFDYDDLYPSQKDAIMMIKQNGGGICDHEVGAGKTMIMCVAAHEMKRLGLVNKPMIIAMKANVHEIANTYRKAYPNAKILYPSKNDFQKENRRNLFKDIKNNNYDCIILSHEQFDKIPQSLETQAAILSQELYDIEQSLNVMEEQQNNRYGYYNRNYGRLLSGLQKRKENMEAKLKELWDDINWKKDVEVNFRDMGIDHIFVDESHKFKNLMFQTRQQRLAGLGNTNGSQRSANLFTAIRDIQARTGKDLGATFLSGTTISNSLSELYILFKYLRPKALKQQNITCFDAWSAVFTRKTNEFEFNVTNQIVQKERLRYFIKVPELAMFYNQITDYRTAESIGIERPKKNEIFKNIPPTPEQENYIKRLMNFARTGDGHYIDRELTDTEIKAKMLIATNLSNKMALDMRLIDAFEYANFAGGKVDEVAKQLYDYYTKYNEQKGTQFVFSDIGTFKSGEWNIYSAIRNKLVEEYNIPEKEIVFIQECTTEKKKAKVLDDMNSGAVRILFGSTNTLGTGVNAQQRAVALHHIDAPWRPSDLEQREGRAIRKGNVIARDFADNKVDIITYATERSLDAYKFNLLNNKQTFISQLKSQQLGSRTMDEGGYDESNGVPFAEYVAILSGNTDLLEKAKLDKQIATLEKEKLLYMKETTSMQREIKYLSKEIDIRNFQIDNITKDITALNKIKGNYVFTNNHNEVLVGREIGKFINVNKQKCSDKVKLGIYAGMDVLLKNIPLTTQYQVVLKSRITNEEYAANAAFPRDYNLGESWLNNLVNSLPERITRNKEDIRIYTKNMETLIKLVEQREWPKKNQLDELKQRGCELEKKIKEEINENKENETREENEDNQIVEDVEIIEEVKNEMKEVVLESISEKTGIIREDEITEPIIKSVLPFGTVFVTARVGNEIQIAYLNEAERESYKKDKSEENVMALAKAKFANSKYCQYTLKPGQSINERLNILRRCLGRQIEVFPQNKLKGLSEGVPYMKEYGKGKCVSLMINMVEKSIELKYNNDNGFGNSIAKIDMDDLEGCVKIMHNPIKVARNLEEEKPYQSFKR